MLIIDAALLILLICAIFYCKKLHQHLQQLVLRKNEFQHCIGLFEQNLVLAEKQLVLLEHTSQKTHQRLYASIETAYHVMNELDFMLKNNMLEQRPPQESFLRTAVNESSLFKPEGRQEILPFRHQAFIDEALKTKAKERFFTQPQETL